MSIELNSVSKEFTVGEPILNQVTATIQTGEFFVIVGPSGCGKSTLLRMIAGLSDITDGQIQISGQVVNELPPKERQLSMVFQNYALYPFLSVWDNVAFGLKARKLEANEIKQRVTDALKMVNLTDFSKRKPRELSGGQQQRVALARAVASDTKICLMDEPLSNLDAQLRVKMRQEISNLQRKLGLTLIYVTHDQVEAMTMADHIMVLNQHQVQQIGTPAEIYRKPANEFVASFFGTPQINILPLKDHFAGPLADNIPDENIVKVGVRPDETILVHADSTHADAFVKSCEFLGNETIVYALMNDGTRIQVVLKGEQIFQANEPVMVKYSGDKLFFDKKGKRIELPKGAVANA
ncbi:MAG TPA: ATP-binding cassette domain-containing protein [Ligilactobacillus acidipiscis]|uniref:ATP-binding cassette domain-containing protein n=1 Tax=Ligilactobacillus acidipiscis TaxID=89059 RepID=A0A921F6A8_9LACO|nr:ATP-binding cassette domain-containing protein [Ligilactobacillus acidipiscis]